MFVCYNRQYQIQIYFCNCLEKKEKKLFFFILKFSVCPVCFKMSVSLPTDESKQKCMCSYSKIIFNIDISQEAVL